METDVGEKEIPSMFPDMITFHLHTLDIKTMFD